MGAPCGVPGPGRCGSFENLVAGVSVELPLPEQVPACRTGWMGVTRTRERASAQSPRPSPSAGECRLPRK